MLRDVASHLRIGLEVEPRTPGGYRDLGSALSGGLSDLDLVLREQRFERGEVLQLAVAWAMVRNRAVPSVASHQRPKSSR
jgi:hypothetical protein